MLEGGITRLKPDCLGELNGSIFGALGVYVTKFVPVCIACMFVRWEGNLCLEFVTLSSGSRVLNLCEIYIRYEVLEFRILLYFDMVNNKIYACTIPCMVHLRHQKIWWNIKCTLS